jgi:hypothetical protein
MKRLIIVLIFMALITPVFAQPISEANASNMYYISVPVERVIMAGEGYIIQYRKSQNNQIGTIGIPYSWFTDAAARAELIKLPQGGSWPTMTVFYREGAFSHIRLYVHRQRSHITWSITPQGADVSRWFPAADSETFDFKY